MQIVLTPDISWFTAYEHVSHDNLNGMLKKTSNEGSGNLINDAMQGITGNFKFPLSENDLKFLGISTNKHSNKIKISVDILRGGYLEGELIDATHPYSTVRTASGFFIGDNFEDGKPILAQWNHPAFDFVSDFFNVFVEDCKKMIDEGCRFMKWDAINTFYSTLPNLHHGSEMYSEEEIRARYEYLLPIYVVKAMEVLTDYEPELVIEMDLTEARRAIVGLAPLSLGKLFWMNNGASWYNDYSTFRTQSMRTIANKFAWLIPLELFTHANYPQNINGNMHYNVHNSLLAGHGFWGNLELMSSEERNWVGEQVSLSKKVLPFITPVNPKVVGKVVDSPEVYSIVNSFESFGRVIVLTAEPCEIEITSEIVPDKWF